VVANLPKRQPLYLNIQGNLKMKSMLFAQIVEVTSMNPAENHVLIGGFLVFLLICYIVGAIIGNYLRNKRTKG